MTSTRTAAAAAPVPVMAVYLDAGNDSNGNPRRGWLILDASGNQIDFVDHGYEGRGALRTRYPDSVETGMICTTPAEYRRMLKLDRAREPSKARKRRA